MTATNIDKVAHNETLADSLERDIESEHTSIDYWWCIRIGVGLLITIFADYLLYQSGFGYTGWAVWLCLLFALAAVSPARRIQSSSIIAGALVLAGIARLIWQGDGFVVASIIVCVVALRLTLQAIPLSIGKLLFVALPLAGLSGLSELAKVNSIRSLAVTNARLRGLINVIVPILIGSVFAIVFLAANPDALRQITASAEDLAIHFQTWLKDIRYSQVAFWVVVFIAVIGLVSSNWIAKFQSDSKSDVDWRMNGKAVERSHDWHALRRNILLTVIAIYVANSINEVYRFWGRSFPDSFAYAAYAHEGAFWLTIALAIATLLLSVMFQSGPVDTNTQPVLVRLIWIWFALNLLLTLGVYYRLWIYIDFNGLTRLRIVGLAGATCVAVGFALVVYRVFNGMNWRWMIDRQIIALLLTIYALTLLPIDWLSYRYNVKRIQAGDLAPATQLSIKEISAEGWLAIAPLLSHEHPAIRNGVRGRLARFVRNRLASTDWRQYQGADEQLMRLLERQEDRLHELSLGEIKLGEDVMRATFQLKQ
jgi:hypothetical protein